MEARLGETTQRVLMNSDNAGVLAYLGGSGRRPVIAVPQAHDDPYSGAGSHPDVVSRIWDDLRSSFRAAEPFLVHGAPALVLSGTGLVVAAALGTSYAVRFSPGALRDALAAGVEFEHRFKTVDVVLNLRSAFGPDWVFGSWHARESAWFVASCEAFSVAAS